jgi:hypothetical protein
MTLNYYTISDFQKLVFEPREYILSDEVYNTIKYLESCLDVSEYSGNHTTSSNVVSKDRKRTGFVGKHTASVHDGKEKSFDSKKKPVKKEVSNEEWEAMRNFKTTKMDVKMGVDKYISDIRITLNKMSDQTYDKLSEKVFELLDEYFKSSDCCGENDAKIVNAIFSVCVSNKFYSSLFANFIATACSKYDIFTNILEEFVEETKTQEIVEYVDSELDYNAYCKYNKLMEERKSKNTFIVNMMKRSKVQETKVVEIVEWYVETIMTNIMIPNRSKEVEELTENLFVLVSGNSAIFEKHDSWTTIYSNIEALGKSGNKQYPSSSNRIVFKFMDILDSI